jgi:hypothetical protein
MAQYDAVYVAGTSWLALGDKTAANRPGWTLLTPEFKEGVATVVEAVAEVEKTLAG